MAAIELTQHSEAEIPLTTFPTIPVSPTANSPMLNGFHVFRKLNLQKMTMWVGKLETAQSLAYCLIWVAMTLALLFKFDQWKKDVEQDPWTTQNLPLARLVVSQGGYFTIFLCLGASFLHMGLGFIGSNLITAAEAKSYEDIRIWLRLSCFISLLQFLNKLILALCNMDGPYLSAFLWIQILFRMASIGIAKNYYDILLLTKDSPSTTSLESLMMDEEDDSV